MRRSTGKDYIILNRISGLVVAVAGVILLFWIIPQHTETADYGWLRPATLPNITAVIVIIASLIQFAFPSGKAEFDVPLALRAGLFFLIALLGLFLMYLTGFLIAVPLLVMFTMLLTGERRLLWLTMGIVLIPLAIWSSVELLLNRPLP
ncbi:MAG: tripartite tricarboxylate transporter TctB family protein [Chloroflexota bacterium]